MSEKRRIALIFGTVAVLAGAGLFYFIKIYQPKQKQQAAQTEIAAWETRFNEARACLLGPAPASGRSGEALAVREMSPDPWNRGTCTKLIGRLTRGVAEDTGLMPVEHAWMTIDRSAARVASSFATHVDPFGETGEKRGKESPLPAALEELDAAHADLRKAAGMSPPPTATTAALPTAEVIPLTHGAGLALTSLDAWYLPSGNATVAYGSLKGTGEVQIVLAPGLAPKLAKIPAGGMRALPDQAWAATALNNEVIIAPVDDQGALGAMTTFAVPSYHPDLGLAVGTFTDGLLAVSSNSQLAFARSTGGPFVLDPPIDIGRATFSVDPAGRGLVGWSTPDGALKAVIARTGAAATPIELGSGDARTSCLTATQGWVGDGSQIVSFDDKGPRPHVLPDHELLGCTASAALLHKLGTTHYVVCTEQCRVADLTGTRSSHIATVVGDKVVAIRTRGHVLGLWREGGAPTYFAMSSPVTPILALTDGKVIDVLATIKDGVVIVRIPAS